MYTITDRRPVSLNPPRHRAFYSVIQFCPDRYRAEAANIGFVVLCPTLNRLDVRLTPDNARAVRLFNCDTDANARIDVSKRAVGNAIQLLFAEGRLADDAALAEYGARLANDIRMTPPRLMLIDDWAVDVESAYVEACKDTPHPGSC